MSVREWKGPAIRRYEVERRGKGGQITEISRNVAETKKSFTKLKEIMNSADILVNNSGRKVIKQKAMSVITFDYHASFHDLPEGI